MTSWPLLSDSACLIRLHLGRRVWGGKYDIRRYSQSQLNCSLFSTSTVRIRRIALVSLVLEVHSALRKAVQLRYMKLSKCRLLGVMIRLFSFFDETSLYLTLSSQNSFAPKIPDDVMSEWESKYLSGEVRNGLRNSSRPLMGQTNR
jgi:hypothetical protein